MRSITSKVFQRNEFIIYDKRWERGNQARQMFDVPCALSWSAGELQRDIEENHADSDAVNERTEREHFVAFLYFFKDKN